jgi:three-Cys-motif partner protein
MKSFGGSWTEQKLNAFIKYVEAYLTILNVYKQKYNWQTVYFDGFAGYGKRNNYNQNENLSVDIFGNEDKEELFVYEGSVKRVLSLEEPFIFDWYYFIDTSSEYIANLEKLKSTITHIKTEKIIIRESNCNVQLKNLANALNTNKNLAALVFLDPFGMQVQWDSIKQLKDTRSDIWILVPSGVAINRMLDRKKELKNREKLETFFGLTVKEIEDIFYKDISEETLFGSVEGIQKIDNPISKILEIYIGQLKKIWRYVTESPLILRNSKNTPIFHLLFASNNRTALKVASEIVEKEQKL